MKSPPILFSLSSSLVLAVLLAAPALRAEPAFEWTETYDGGAAYDDWNVAALVDPQGNLVVAGESYDTEGGSDMLIRKLDRLTSQTLWSVRYPAFDGNDMELSATVWDGYGNIFVAGFVEGCVG